jgi:bacteriocin biosynthesis cyclodehydratase domain-containing protein
MAVPTLHWNNSWRASAGEAATIDGGADARFTLRGVDPADLADLLALLNTDGTLDPESVAPHLTPVLEVLSRVGALTAESRPESPAPVRVHAAGPASRYVSDQLAERLGATCSDLFLVVRSGDRLEDLNATTVPDGPHLLIDVAYRHRIVIGPLVLPSLTACLSCYAGRLAYRWGDPQPPPEPAASRRVGLIAELVTLEMERVASQAGSLTNACVVFDTEELTTVREPVFKLPWCPRCGPQVTPQAEKAMAW